MISGGGSHSGTGRKSLDAEVNLVPFIDLLSMCICFLLMTAVWIQIGALEVKQSKGTEAGANGVWEMDLRFTSAKSLDLNIKKNNRPFKSIKVTAPSSDLLPAQLEAALPGMLVAMGEKGTVPTANAPSPVSAAMVTPAKGVAYGDLVAVMDRLRKFRIVNLGVVPVGGN